MSLANPLVRGVGAPPVALGAAWGAAYDGRSGPLIDCSQAVPGHPPPALLAEALGRAAQAPAVARYGPIPGDPAFRAAYAAHVSARYGTEIAPERVVVTAGCNQAFVAAIVALARAGEAVLLPTPWYFNHQMTLAMLGIEARPLPTRPEDGFLARPEAVEAAIDDRVRALVIVSPNNPTGAVYPPATIERLFAICRERNIALILDETYRDFLDPEAGPPHRLFGMESADTHLLSLYSFSKAYAIPGHRLGAVVAGTGMVGELVKVIDCVQICAPRVPQAALAADGMIEALAPFRDETARAIAARAALFRDTIAGVPGWDLLQIGAYFAYLRHPFRGVSSRIVAEALAERMGIVALPGSFFGPAGEDFLRVAFANVGDAAVAEIGRRLSRFRLD